MTEAKSLLRLLTIQRDIERLRDERDELIRGLDGKVGVNELGRAMGLSGAQISRIRNRAE
jgi:hypothetical protein